MRFVIWLKNGESMASLCGEFGISRKTGYKIWERYQSSTASKALRSDALGGGHQL